MAPSYVKLFAIVLFTTLCTLVLAKEEIHLQWAICDKDAETVLHKLGKGGKKPYKAHEITYYDSSPPQYTAQGLAFRTKVKKHRLISMVKARFDEKIDDIPSSADCVWDQYGNKTSYTCGLGTPVSKVKHGIWSSEQVDFAEDYQEVDWDSLVPYGPFMDPKWKLRVAGYKGKFDDVIAKAGGETLHLMEIEVGVKVSKGDKAYKEITRYLEEHDVVLCDTVLPKTTRLFQFLEQQQSSSSDHAKDSKQAVLRHWGLR